jgi:hypothetical protein
MDAMPVDPRIQRAKDAIRRARLYTWCNRLTRWLPSVFCVFVTLFVIAVWIGATKSEYYGAILAIPTAAAVLVSGITYPFSLSVRDMLNRGQKPWQFSIFHLLYIMTCVSIGMGAMIFLVKRLP